MTGSGIIHRSCNHWEGLHWNIRGVMATTQLRSWELHWTGLAGQQICLSRPIWSCRLFIVFAFPLI